MLNQAKKASPKEVFVGNHAATFSPGTKRDVVRYVMSCRPRPTPGHETDS